MAETTNWRAVAVAYLAGVYGSTQVGRVAPAVEAIGAELNLGLALLGWAVSLITLASALAGLPAGVALHATGAKRLLTAGCAILAAASGLSALADGTATLLALRALEGAGYLFLVVAAPTLIAQASSDRDMASTLALWGTFFTCGLSLAAFVGGWASDSLGWRGWFALNAAAGALILPVIWSSIPADRQAETTNAMRHGWSVPRAVWLWAGAFFGVSLSALTVLSMMPPYLIEIRAMPSALGGGLTGFVALSSIAGSLFYAGTVRRVPVHLLVGGAVLALIVSVFPAFLPAVPVVPGIAATAIAVAATGVLVAHVFASIPRLAGDPYKVGPANGLVAQIGSIGAFIGPPLVGALVSGFGWVALSALVTLCGTAFLALSAHSERVASRRAGGH